MLFKNLKRWHYSYAVNYESDFKGFAVKSVWFARLFLFSQNGMMSMNNYSGVF